MNDMEKIITHLQIIHTWAEFARERDLQFFTAKHLDKIVQWTDDAINLLEEQPEIIMCKDCKLKDRCEISGGFDGLNPDWFCADGQR